MTNGPFYLPAQPSPGDARERNAFGFLTSFGKAYSAYYARRAKLNNTNLVTAEEFKAAVKCLNAVPDGFRLDGAFTITNWKAGEKIIGRTATDQYGTAYELTDDARTKHAATLRRQRESESHAD